MRFVDGDKTNRAVAERCQRCVLQQPFRGNIEQIEVASLSLLHHYFLLHER